MVREDGIDFENAGNGYGDRRRDRSEGTIRVCVSPWSCVIDGYTCVTTAVPPWLCVSRGSVWPIGQNKVTPADELLLDAAMRCDLDEVDAAIGAMANPAKDGPLLLAAQHGGTLVVQRLAQAGASVNTPGAYGKTPLILAAEKGHSAVIETLVRSGANLDAAMAPGGQTALHLVGEDQQCPLQMARMCTHLLLTRNADPLIRDQWGRTAEEYHRRRADLPNARALPAGGSMSHAPLRDGRAVIIAGMIKDKVARETALLVAMQKLCWMRLLQRNYSRPEMSYGAESAAYPITVSPMTSTVGDLERVDTSSTAASNSTEGPREAVYTSLVLRIIKDFHALCAPLDATLSRHIRGLRDRYYREQLPSFQVFTEKTK